MKNVAKFIFISIVLISIASIAFASDVTKNKPFEANAWASIYKDCNRPNYAGFCDASIIIEHSFNAENICWVHINSHQKEWQKCIEGGGANAVRSMPSYFSVGLGPIRETSPTLP